MSTTNKPKQYLQGYAEFYKLRFRVTPDVLIPRPETELLVDEVIQFVKEIAAASQSPHNDACTGRSRSVIAGEAKQSSTILDVGTGSGNIIISLAKNLSHIGGVTFIASDISAEALEVAKQNAKLHGVEDQITFLKSDLLHSFCHSERSEESHTEILRFTQDDNLVIVTNLPYIPSERIPYLDSSVKDFESHVALDGGPDGFDLYRKLFQQLKEKNWLARRSLGEGRKLKIFVGEVDYTHGELAINEAQKNFPQAKVEVKTDLAHKQRILTISSVSLNH